MGADMSVDIERAYREAGDMDSTTAVLFIFAVFGFVAVVDYLYRHFFPPTQEDKDYEMQLQMMDYFRRLR